MILVINIPLFSSSKNIFLGFFVLHHNISQITFTLTAFFILQSIFVALFLVFSHIFHRYIFCLRLFQVKLFKKILCYLGCPKQIIFFSCNHFIITVLCFWLMWERCWTLSIMFYLKCQLRSLPVTWNKLRIAKWEFLLLNWIFARHLWGFVIIKIVSKIRHTFFHGKTLTSLLPSSKILGAALSNHCPIILTSIDEPFRCL